MDIFFSVLHNTYAVGLFFSVKHVVDTHEGPVVQSVISLTSLLRVISLTVLAIQYTIF